MKSLTRALKSGDQRTYQIPSASRLVYPRGLLRFFQNNNNAQNAPREGDVNISFSHAMHGTQEYVTQLVVPSFLVKKISVMSGKIGHGTACPPRT